MERRKSGFSVFKESKVAIAGSVLIILVVLAAIFAPLLSPYDPRDQSILNRFSAPKADDLFGTDEFGRDILSRVIWGSRTSLTVGILSVLFAGFTGTGLGIIAGFRGGITENVIMRFADGGAGASLHGPARNGCGNAGRYHHLEPGLCGL